MEDKISVIIPVYNEEDRIKDTLMGLIDSNIKELGEIIVIDDGSKDKTKEKVQEINSNLIYYFKLPYNCGKGAALRKGVEISRYSIIAFLDGDLGNSSKEIIKLIEPIYQDSADVVIAKFPPVSVKGGFGVVKKISHKGVHMLTGKEIENPICGQRVFKKNILFNIEIPDRFGAEVGMTIDILKQGLRVKEVSVLMNHRETKRDVQGFIHRGREFINILFVLIKKYYKYKNVATRR